LTRDESHGGRRWPPRSRPFWGVLLAGVGIGLMLGAALVELGLLSPHGKAWVSLLGIVSFGVGLGLSGLGPRGSLGRS
jgi:hypothetical protein